MHKPAKEPNDLEKFFVERANQGDIEGLVALYEPNAIVADGHGAVAIGLNQIRELFVKFLTNRPALEPSIHAEALCSGDLALTSSRLSNGDITAEVAKRQADGSWLWVVDQFALGNEASRMPLRPSEPDRQLTVETARSAIRVAFPDVDIRTIQHLGSGWEFDAFRTADDWVFRFPRRAEAQELFEREAPILELVRPRLAPETTVPLVERLGPPTDAFPYQFAGHRFIEGVAADSLPRSLHAELARSIGAALGAVHSVPLEAARAAGVVELDRPEAERRVWFERGLSNASKLVGSDPVVDRAVEWVRSVEDPLRRLDAPLRFIHDDLSPEHILVDPKTGHVSGILDWTDASLGDAARDFAVLVAFGGRRFVEAVVDGYSHKIDSGFYERLRFMARLLPVMWLGEAYAKNEDISKHLRWVRNAFVEESAP